MPLTARLIGFMQIELMPVNRKRITQFVSFSLKQALNLSIRYNKHPILLANNCLKRAFLSMALLFAKCDNSATFFSCSYQLTKDANIEQKKHRIQIRFLFCDSVSGKHFAIPHNRGTRPKWICLLLVGFTNVHCMLKVVWQKYFLYLFGGLIQHKLVPLKWTLLWHLFTCVQHKLVALGFILVKCKCKTYISID